MKTVKTNTEFLKPTDQNISDFEDDFLKRHRESAEKSSFFKNVFYLCKRVLRVYCCYYYFLRFTIKCFIVLAYCYF